MDIISKALQSFLSSQKQNALTALSNLDPANEKTPILGPIRAFDKKIFGQQPYADPNLPWDQRLANAISQYGNSFIGAHGAGPIGDAKVLPSILREGQDPIGFNSTYDAVARERFNIGELAKLGKLGAGSDRDVYDLGDGQVLKIAKQARGLSQNYSEGDSYAPVPEVIERGNNYVVSEKVDKPNAKTKQLVNDIQDSYAKSGYGRAHISDVMNPLIEKYSNAGDEDTANLLSDLMNYDPMIGDLGRIVNWGSKNGEPILLDGGALSGSTLDTYKGITNMADPEFRNVVMRSRQAKKKFGDTDKNTMYGITAALAALIGGKNIQNTKEQNQ